MDPTVVINLALVVVTAFGVVVAALQARDARNARDEANTARDEAKEYERRAVTASEVSAGAAQRSATALEKQVDLQIAQMPTDPWELIKHRDGRYEVKNISKVAMFAVDILDLGGANDITLYEDGPFAQVGAGESVFFAYEKSFESHAQTTLQVSWGDPMTAERSRWRKTIS